MKSKNPSTTAQKCILFDKLEKLKEQQKIDPNPIRAQQIQKTEEQLRKISAKETEKSSRKF